MNENFKVSTMGVISKTLFGILIVFVIAMPKILSGNILFSGISGFFMVIVLGIIWRILFNMLKTDRGAIVNLLLYMFTCALLGLFFSNSIVISIYYISYFSDDAVNAIMINQAIFITALATLVAVIGGTIMLPKIKVDGKVAKFGKNFMILLSALSIGYIIIFAIGFILSLFGATWLLDGIYAILFGIGPISIIISVIMVIFAMFLFLASAATVRAMIGTEEKHMEYLASMILVNAIIQIFAEIFKLVLKILALLGRNNRR